MDVRAALKGQYHAALAMLKHAIERCPEDLWTGGGYPVPFWQVVYHTLFYTHLYLQPNSGAFRPWKHHREKYENLRQPVTDTPYTKPELLEYWALCDQMVDTAVDQAELDADECGFHWYKLPKLDHQINNIRHVQHHAALLAGRLRLDNGTDIRWAKGESNPSHP